MSGLGGSAAAETGAKVAPALRLNRHQNLLVLRRNISQTLDTWKMTEISRVSVCSEKQDFAFNAISEA